MSSQWWQRDRFDLNRPVEESLRPITLCLIEVKDGKLSYRREKLGSNGNTPAIGASDAQADTEVSQSPVEVALVA